MISMTLEDGNNGFLDSIVRSVAAGINIPFQGDDVGLGGQAQRDAAGDLVDGGILGEGGPGEHEEDGQEGFHEESV